MKTKESIEIPFGAKDSELKGWEYTIPEGMKARIEGNKVIIGPKENEDEKVRKALIDLIYKVYVNTNYITCKEHEDILAWLEKQGEKVYALKSSKDEDVHKFVQYIERQAKAYELNLPNRSYDIYGFAKDILSWLEKQGAPQVRTGIEWENTIDDACDKIYSEDYNHGEYCHEQSFKWGFQEGVEWLEKQGEQKSIDKVEPKFKVGDWVINTITKEVEQVIELTDCEYICSGHLIISFDNQYLLKRWTIQDAKDGDILATNGFIFVFKEIREDKGIGYYCANEDDLHEGDDSTFHISAPNSLMGSINNNFTHYTPATEEQRNFLFQKMEEAGYKWDSEKKELKKIEQKPAWSEEDEMMLENALDKISDLGTGEMVKNWLKSLKERYTWKPSDEQMEALDDFIYAKYPNTEKHGAAVKSLYQDLKKLKEE